MTVDGGASIVVLSFNGAEVLPRTLPRLLAALDAHGGDHEVIVVDNGSTDATPSVLAAFGSAIKAVRLPRNRGVAGGFNAGVAAASRSLVVTLPNDMLVDARFLAPLLAPFSAPDVAAVSSKRLTMNNWVIHGHLRYRYDAYGLFDILRPGISQEDGPEVGFPTVTWYAPWANAAWRRDFLTSIGGFEEGFGGALSWWAEADPSYRAWKRGWRVLFAPDSVVYHLDVQTGWRGVDANEGDFWFKEGLMFFTWVSLTDPGPLHTHLKALPALVGSNEPWVKPHLDYAGLLADDGLDPDSLARRLAALPSAPPSVRGWPWAFASMVHKLPQVIRRRRADRPYQRRTDAEVFQTVNV